MIERWKAHARGLKRDTYAMYLAVRDPRTPWYVRVLAMAILAYALSPIDLIPDFVPVLGYVDDLILVPMGLALLTRLLPSPVLNDARARATEVLSDGRPTSFAGAVMIVGIWLATAALGIVLLARVLG